MVSHGNNIFQLRHKGRAMYEHKPTMKNAPMRENVTAIAIGLLTPEVMVATRQS
jgi:hypothetical protein